MRDSTIKPRLRQLFIDIFSGSLKCHIYVDEILLQPNFNTKPFYSDPGISELWTKTGKIIFLYDSIVNNYKDT